jgi:hypothetical protein
MAGGDRMARLIDWNAEMAALDEALPEMRRKWLETQREIAAMWDRFRVEVEAVARDDDQ